MKIQQDFEKYLEEKAYELVEPVVGRGNVTVRVAAAMDFDQLGRTVESFDLDQQFTVREDRAEITPGSAEQGASSLTVNSIYEAPKTVETFARIGSRVDRLTVAVVVSDREEGPEEAPSYNPRSPEELGRIESLVRSGLGVDQGRGDAITVVSMPFNREPVVVPEEEAGPDIIAMVQAGVRPAIGILALIFAFILSLRLLKFMKSVPLGPNEERTLAPGEDRDGLPSDSTNRLAGAGAGPRAMAGAGTTGQVELTDPNLTARVVKAWLSED